MCYLVDTPYTLFSACMRHDRIEEIKRISALFGKRIKEEALVQCIIYENYEGLEYLLFDEHVSPHSIPENLFKYTSSLKMIRFILNAGEYQSEKYVKDVVAAVRRYEDRLFYECALELHYFLSIFFSRDELSEKFSYTQSKNLETYMIQKNKISERYQKTQDSYLKIIS